jgi:hypothetical protein
MTMTPQEALRLRRASYSLGLTGNQVTLIVLLGPLIAAISLRLAPQLWDGQRGLLFGAMHIVVPVLAAFIINSRLRASRLRWLEQLSLPVDRAAYLDAMGAQIRHGRMVVRVALEGDAVPALPDLGALPGATAEAAPGALVVRSPAMSLSTLTVTGRLPTHNGKVHRWFRRCVDDALTPWAAKTNVKAIRPDLEAV